MEMFLLKGVVVPRFIYLFVILSMFLGGSAIIPSLSNAKSAIFFHPDGMGVNTWQVLRYIKALPKGGLNWDKLDNMGIYVGNLSDYAVATSNGGATAHAYGVMAKADSYGLIDGEEITSKSGFRGTIVEEAKFNGFKTALINSGSVIEPGTGVFVARSKSRYDYDPITEQILNSGVDVILSGGEKHMLPKGVRGRHGVGTRRDSKNLIELAIKGGYKVVYTKEELKEAIKERPEKLLGVFASGHTFNDMPEERLKKMGLPRYLEHAPTVGQMVEAALELFKGQEFFMVVEEEATDNFLNEGNPHAVIDAAKRADEALGVMLDYKNKYNDTMILTASDSDAGGLQLLAKSKSGEYSYKSADDKQIYFDLKNVGLNDYSGGILVRSTDKIPNVVYNTEIYSILRVHLFGS